MNDYQNVLPKVIISTVIRTAEKGEVHGQIYFVNLKNKTFKCIIKWSDPSINWDGRGGDRGLRGIALHDNNVYIATSKELLVYNRQFNFITKYTNKYLKDCHELFLYGNKLYLTSSGYDSILIFDIITKTFMSGYCIHYKEETFFQKQKERVRKKFFKKFIPPKHPLKKYIFYPFDPNMDNGPDEIDTIHLNNVFVDNETIYFAGQKNTDTLLKIYNDKLTHFGELLNGSHNAQPYKNQILFNDTSRSRILLTDKFGGISKTFNIPKYNEKILTNTNLPINHARQGWVRGLAIFRDKFLIVGSSPATIYVYSLHDSILKTSIQLSNDIRTTIHGLEIWY